MLLDIIKEYDESKKEFLKDIWAKTIKNLSTIEDPKKILSFLNKCGIIGIDDTKMYIYIGIPSEFVLSQIKKFFNKKLNRSIEEVYNEHFSVKYVIYSPFQSGKSDLQINIKKLLNIKETINTEKILDETSKKKFKNMFGILFEPQFNFNNFVVGSYNELAYSAAKAVSENPGKIYNPLFLYGDSGLGKTHLLQSIGNYIIQNDQEKTVIYFQTTKFIDKIVEAIRNKKLSEFYKKLEDVDVLIIDDIQFLAGKEKTQEIFHNIFNDFQSKKKQIVLSSDKPPKELKLLESRLRTRFALGLVADIKKSDFETRLAILKSKLDIKGEYIEKELLEILARCIKSNIRELEGILNLVLTKKNLLKKEINEDEIYDSLKTLGYQVREDQNKKINIDNAENINSKSNSKFSEIVGFVANYYGIEIDEIRGDSRKKEISIARQMLMYIAKKHFNWTLEKIGDYFGGKNHATVIYAVDKFEKIMKSDKKIYNDLHIILEENS